MRKILFLWLLPMMTWGQNASVLKVQQGVRFTSFSMTTQNGLFGPHAALTDYYANAVGLDYLLHAKKGKWRFDAEVYSSALVFGNPWELDQLTSKTSRYEGGLFAVNAKERRVVVVPSIAEWTYLGDRFKMGFGNFALEGTFLNMEHGRMIPSTFTGLHLDWKQGQWKYTFAAISHVGARSTSGFKTIANSLAQYNPGLDTSGSRHDMSQVETPGILYFSGKNTHVFKQWYGSMTAEYYGLPGVFHTVVWDEKLAHNQHLIQLQYIRQEKWGNGGNADPYLAYFQQQRSQYFGLKYSNKVGDVDYYSAISHIDGNGKLLFPREWGREYLVTFQGRERQEGMGRTTAVVFGASGKWQQGKVGHNGGVSTGIYVRPEPGNYKYNKYAMPSNQQTNVWWGQQWKGGTHKLLAMLVYKVPLGSQTLTAGQTINKVDMVNVNLIYRYQPRLFQK